MNLPPKTQERTRLIDEINALRRYLNQFGDAPTWTRRRLKTYVNARWDVEHGLTSLGESELGEVHEVFCEKLRARLALHAAQVGMSRPSLILRAEVAV